MNREQHLEAALARFTQNRYVVLDNTGRYIDTSVTYDGDVVIFDRKAQRPRPADMSTAIRTLGPLVSVESRLAERHYEVENGGV